MSPIWVHRNPLLFQHPGVFHVCILKQLLFFLSFLAMHHSLLSLSIILYILCFHPDSRVYNEGPDWGCCLFLYSLNCLLLFSTYYFILLIIISLFFIYSSIPIYFTYWCLVTLRRLSLIYILVTNEVDKFVSFMTIKQNQHDICDHSWMKLILL